MRVIDLQHRAADRTVDAILVWSHFAEPRTLESAAHFPRCRLDKLLASDMALSQEIISSLMGSLERAQNHAVLLRHDTAKERMSAFLVDMAERAAKGGNLALRLRQSDIADYLGLSRETVSRILTQLARKHRAASPPINRSAQHGRVPFQPILAADTAD